MDVPAPAHAAASLLLRHLGAYGELITEELALAYGAFLRRLWAGIVLVLAGVFSIALACVWAIAATWRTPAQMWMIAGLFALFVAATAISLLILKARSSAAPALLTRTGQEWHKDRLLLDDLLVRLSGKAE
jgi:uncharacterized membrane protein YqjE